ncbi:MAG: lactate racemase domain-containing protein [Candidatus Bathyarchaeia archaeon]
MRVELVFGDEWINVTLPNTARAIQPFSGIPLEPVRDLGLAINEALSNPLDAKPLREFVKPHWKILIAFDDPTVPCYAPVWENAILTILEELKKVGVGKNQITLLCANALHRKFRLSELENILGTPIVEEFKDRILCHDAEDPEGVAYLGKTSSGYDVEINRQVVEADLTIYVNTLSTGFNGGWKSICVGLSTWRSIRWHHTPEIMTMSLVKNPMHEILNAMGALFSRV